MRIRIRAGQKHADPADPDPDPKPWFFFPMKKVDIKIHIQSYKRNLFKNGFAAHEV